MSERVLITKNKLDTLAISVSNKSNFPVPMTLAEMKTAIDSIVIGQGGIIPTGTINITTNGIHDVTNYANANVNISSSSPIFQSKTATPTESSQTITADSGYDGLSSVEVGAVSNTYVGSGIDQRDSTDLTASGATVSVPAGYYAAAASKSVASGSEGTPTATKGTVSNHSISITPSVTNTEGYISGGTYTGTAVSVSASELVSGTKSITANGTGIDVTDYAEVDVAIPIPIPSLQSKSVTPTESAQTIEPDSGYDGLSEVSIGAISSTYVGSGITRRTSSDVYQEDEYAVIPPGLYTDDPTWFQFPLAEVPFIATKGTVANNSISVTPGYDVSNTVYGFFNGLHNTYTPVTISASELVSGTYTISASGTHDVTNYASASVAAGSATAPSSISGTAASVSTGTNTLTLSKTVSVTPSVTAGYVSSGTAGNSSVSLTANVTTKAAATITPGTTDQTIAAGTYLTGAQTIAGDANLVSSNIISGASIFGVSGSVAFQTIYSGSSDPAAATGSNGDIYIKVVS